MFLFKLRNVGGPLLWEALGHGLLGLGLKRALVTALAFFNENATLHFVVSLPNARTVILPIKKNRAFEHGL